MGTAVYFALQQYLSNLGSWYLIILGAFAIVVMLKAPRGIWGLIVDRCDIRLFSVQLRVRFVPGEGTHASEPLPFSGEP